MLLVTALMTIGTGCAESEVPDEPIVEAVEPGEEEEDATADLVDSLFADEGERSVEQKIRDASISASVQLALADDHELRAYRIEPLSVNGRVVLQGDVDTPAQRQRAESVAIAVNGVRGVINYIVSVEEPSIAASRGPIEDSASRRDPSGAEGSDALSPDSPQASGSIGGASSAASNSASPVSESAGQSSAASSQASPESPTSSPQASESADSGAAYHTVRSGDNLWDIARAYDVTVDQIRQLNSLSSNSIRPGQRLRVR